MSEKINKSFLTEEAKNDINEMLDNNSGGGGSSFTTQIETSEGLTLGKGTADEESLTAEELTNIKKDVGKLAGIFYKHPNPVIATLPPGSSTVYVTPGIAPTGLKPSTEYTYIYRLTDLSGTGNKVTFFAPEVRGTITTTESGELPTAFISAITYGITFLNSDTNNLVDVGYLISMYMYEGDIIKRIQS